MIAAGSTPIDEQIRRGQEAIEAYDYELARAILADALERSQGGEAAALALLVFLVDHLGADQDALALGEGLSREALASLEVRRPLALAAARSGDRARAQLHLAGLQGAAASEILVVLADAALATGEVDEAGRLCDEARAQDPLGPGVQEVAGRLARSREALRRPQEEEIELFLGEGELAEARRIAEALLVRFPESAVARRVVRVAVDGEHAEAARSRVDEAEAALAGEDPAALRTAFQAARAAVAAAPLDDALARRLAAVEAVIAARELEERIEGVVRRLADAEPRAGLAEYASLAPEVRRRIREATDLQLLGDLEALLDRRSDAEACVDAVIAFHEATAIAERDPTGALAILAAQERGLLGLRAASRLRAELQRRLREARLQELAGIQDAARAGLERGDAAGALERLGTLDLRELGPTERAAAEALRAGARALQQTREQEAAYERLLQEGDPLAAREVAEGLLARADADGDGAGRDRRQAQVDAARAASRRAFGVWVAEAADDANPGAEAPVPVSVPVPMGAPLDMAFPTEDALQVIDPASGSLVVRECCERWVFLVLVDLESRRVRARAVLRAPEPLDHGVGALGPGPGATYTLAGGRGAVLRLSLETWEPLRWRASQDVLGGESLDVIEIAPGGRYVWVDARSARNGRGAGRLRVFDLERRREARAMTAAGWWFRPIVGADPPTMGCSRRNDGLSLHRPDGAPIEGGRIALPADLRAVVLHPAEGRLLVFVGDDEERFGYVEIDDAGRSSPIRWLVDADGVRSWGVATSSAAQRTFLVAYDGDQVWLHAFGPERPRGPIVRLYRVPLPGYAQLAIDPSSERVVALIADRERLHVLPLGAEAPTVPECVPVPERAYVPGVIYGCPRSSSLPAELHTAVDELRGQHERVASAWLRRQLAAVGGDAAGLLDIHEALRNVGHSSVAGELLGWMRERHPADPHLALVEADALARDRRWSDVRARLEGVDPLAIDVERRQHAYHLLALALFHEGERERAHAVAEDGQRASEGRCDLALLVDATAPLDESLLPEEGPQAPIRTLRMVIREADAAWSRGDLAGARAALDVPVVWGSREVQSLARLAEAELQRGADADVGTFRRALALARFLDVQRRDGSLRRELPLADASWSPERIAEVERRAALWLEQLGPTQELHTEPACEAHQEPPGEPHRELPCEAHAEPHDEPPPEPHLGPRAEPAPPTWTLALDELDAALEAIAADESPAAPVRLAFRVHHRGRELERVDPLIQRWLGGGRFSTGQLADAKELAALAEQTSGADAAVVDALTAGRSRAPRSPSSWSRAPTHRLLDALIGHPRVFLAESPGEPVCVRRARLSVELVDDAGGVTLRFLVGGARLTAEEVLARARSSLLVDVDVDAKIITVAPLGAEARALAQALDRHRPDFPLEGLGELLCRLGALQRVLDLVVPEALAGERREAEVRPVVRLTPEGDAELRVEIGVRPLPGALFVAPGEGAAVVHGAVDGRRVSAERDLVRELDMATRITTLSSLEGALREGRWRYRLVDEASLLGFIEALAGLVDAVVVEWPKDALAWRCLGTVTRKALRVRVTRTHDLLHVDGEAEIDGHRVAIELLLAALREGRRYVILGPRRFVALAAELRERLDAAKDLLHPAPGGRGGLTAGFAAAPVLADLEGDAAPVDDAWGALWRAASLARALDPELPADLRAELRPYQREGFRWLARLAAWGAGACLADDMGLGKTLQTLALLLHRAALGPALVVAPTSVTAGWLSECARFAPGLRARSYRGSRRAALLVDARPGDLLVAGYGVLTRDADALAGVCFATLVLDEAQMIKNPNSRRARAACRVQAEFRVALTGTPVENHLGELWSLYRAISPGLLGTWAQFRERFAAPIERDQSGERRAALGRVLRPFLLRRTKEAVLPELPPRIEVGRLVSLTRAERELYETARLAAAVSIAEATDPSERFAVLGWLTRLRRLACHPRLFDAAWTGPSSKLAAFLAIIDELRGAHHRALVFSQFTDHLAIVRDALEARGVSVVSLDGSTPIDQRTRRVEAFQRGEADLFLISLKAGGTGLNLTAADHVIHLDPWWNPAAEDQATDRAHRIGQACPVTVIRLIAAGTIEEAVLALHADKRELAERLLEGSDAVGRLSAEALLELVRRGSWAEETDTSEEDDRDDGPELDEEETTT